MLYCILGIFCVGLIFANSLKLPKIDIAKNKLDYTSSLRVLEIAENKTQWKFNTPSKCHFRQNFQTWKIPNIYDSTNYYSYIRLSLHQNLE